MKLTLHIKLLPTKEQHDLLVQTIKESNRCCNIISKTAWESRIFNQFKLHKQVYHQIRNTTKLSSQIVIRCISKVTDSYKIKTKKARRFKLMGGIAYDSRVLNYKEDSRLSIWCWRNGRSQDCFM